MILLKVYAGNGLLSRESIKKLNSPYDNNIKLEINFSNLKKTDKTSMKITFVLSTIASTISLTSLVNGTA